MPTIIIRGTPIDFPDSGSSEDWSPAVIEFAQAVAEALTLAVGTYDVPPQVQIIDASNPGTDVNITSLNFPTSNVRAAFIRYTVFRETDSVSAYEAGDLIIVFSADNPVNSKWEITRGNITGDGKITFTVTDTGQVRFSTTAIAGLNHTGRLSFEARALEQS
jgi:hypothetical protein